MSKDPRNIDPDDFFAETRMSFGDHIEDLRVHLWRAIKGFFVACLLGFFLGSYVLEFIAKPVQDQLEAFYDNRTKKTLVELDEQGPNKSKEANVPSKWFRVEFSRSQIRAVLDKDWKRAEAAAENTPSDDIDDSDVVR